MAKCADVLSKYFQRWSLLSPNQPTGRAPLMVYLEALSDLTPNQIEIGCREAEKLAERFPWPGHIRKALEASLHSESEEFLGLPLLAYTPVSQEDRDEALKFSAALKEALAKLPAAPASKQKITIRPSILSLDEQKKILRKEGFLK